MKTSELDYELPRELIAQTPIEPRDAARLLVLDRASRRIAHRRFRDLVEYVQPGDVVVFNDTRVIRARLAAVKVPSGGRVELLLLRRLDALTWQCLVGGSAVRAGARLRILPATGPAATTVMAEIVVELERGLRVLRFDRPLGADLEVLGDMPLPPYIRQPLHDPERYQTVYARAPGSAAAPTAGLHFTQHTLQALGDRGARLAYVDLQVGLDTFRPIDEDEVEQHRIHTERCHVSAETAEVVTRARQAGGRLIAVGTTVVRALETAAAGEPGGISAFDGDTSLFIVPGYRFRVVDVLLTNFHLPRSSLLALVGAFAGRELILHAYRTAIAEGYRFYSFGDAMLIL